MFTKDEEERIRLLARIETKRMLRRMFRSITESAEGKHARMEKALDEDDEGDWDL